MVTNSATRNHRLIFSSPLFAFATKPERPRLRGRHFPNYPLRSVAVVKTLQVNGASLDFVPDACHGKLLFGTSADTVTQLFCPHLLCIG